MKRPGASWTSKWPVGQVVKTRPFHGCNMGSIPVRVTKTSCSQGSRMFFFISIRFGPTYGNRTARARRLLRRVTQTGTTAGSRPRPTGGAFFRLRRGKLPCLPIYPVQSFFACFLCKDIVAPVFRLRRGSSRAALAPGLEFLCLLSLQRK